MENLIDRSIAFSKYDVSSDEEDCLEPVSRWIVCGKRKRLVDEKPDDQPEKPAEPSMKQHWSEKLLSDDDFKNVPNNLDSWRS